MSCENLRKNIFLIDKGKRTNLYLFIIESDKVFDKVFKYKKIFYLLDLDTIDLKFLDSEPSTPFLNKIKSYLKLLQKNHRKLKILQKKNFYLAILRVVDIDQRDDPSQPKKDLKFIDEEIGMAISPDDILKDLLNIFALYWGSYFTSSNLFISHGLNLENLINGKNFEEFGNFTQNIDIFTQLREEQFYFIQKSLKMYNLSLETSNINVSLAMSLLVSSIEILSQKYQWADMKFENLRFGKEIVKLYNNDGELTDKKKNEYTMQIETLYMKDIYKVKANFVEFCKQLLMYTHFFNELTEILFRNLYDVRSQFLHVGEQKSNNKDQIWQFNVLNSSKNNIKSFKHKNGKMYAKIIRIPSYNRMKVVIQEIITRFVNYLHSVKNSGEDKNRYYGLIYHKDSKGEIINDKNGNPIILRKIGDFKERNIITVSPRVPKKPGLLVMGNELYREIDYMDLDLFRYKSKKIEELNVKEEFNEAIKLANEVISSEFFSMEFGFPRQIIYKKIFALSLLKRYEEANKLFELYEIHELSYENLSLFNLKAYNMGYLGEFERAHETIDKVLEFVKKAFDKELNSKSEKLADYSDSKGEIFQLEGKFKNALDWYEVSLKYGDFPINEKTKKKILECKEKEVG